MKREIKVNGLNEVRVLKRKRIEVRPISQAGVNGITADSAPRFGFPAWTFKTRKVRTLFDYSEA